MFVNLFILFICINVALGLVTGVDGSPLKVNMAGDCDPYPETVYGADVNDLDGDGDTTEIIRLSGAPDIDPVIGSGISEDMDELTEEMRRPTNSTDTDSSYQGDGNPFNAITDPILRGWKSMETMLNVVSGGYIFDIIENTTLDCQLDKRAFLTDDADCLAVKQADGSNHSPLLTAPCENPFYGFMNKPKIVESVQSECVDWYTTSGHAWLDVPAPVAVNAPCFVDAPNDMWIQFKYGTYIIFSMLMVITIFYWMTGRGHILSG